MPLGSFLPSGHADDITGSISNQEIDGFLAGEDWIHARTALVSALDPQGSGSAVHWTNPASGARGFFAAEGKAYPSEAGICRAFTGDIDRNDGEKKLQGMACTDKAGEWTVTSIKQAKRT